RTAGNGAARSARVSAEPHRRLARSPARRARAAAARRRQHAPRRGARVSEGANSGSRATEADPAGLARLRATHRPGGSVHVRVAARSTGGTGDPGAGSRPAGVSILMPYGTLRDMRRVVFAIGALAIALVAHAAAPIPVMLLDGESGGRYHDWEHVTPVLKKMRGETGLFAVTVVTTPPAGSDFSAFAPAFTKYRVVVLNYDAPDDRWPAALKTSFEQYVSSGGGVVSVHAADNAFPKWTAFNEM